MPSILTGQILASAPTQAAANVVRKVYAYNLSASATLSQIIANWTNGAGNSPTLFSQDWLSATNRGLAVTPPGYLFAVPANSTLSLKVSNVVSPTHYNIYWFNESS